MNNQYHMNREQFAQLLAFYKKLGYNEAQAKRLSENCFGDQVVCDDNAPYEPGWTFMASPPYRSYPSPPGATGTGAPGRTYAAAAMSRSMPPLGASGMTGGAISMGMTGMAGLMGAMPFAQAQAAPMAAPSAPPPGGPAGPVFNAAETKNPRENEAHSPLDTSQAIFSANVNTGSWSYLRNMIRMKRPIDSSFVRIEEILNSYPYRLDPPVGGDLFAVSTEYASCPWNREEDLMLVEMKAKKANTDVRQNLVLLIDVSGSMWNQWVLVQMSAAAIMSKLKKGDTLSIISYSDVTKTVARQIDCGDTDACVDALLAVEGTSGGTHGSEGLENAYNYLRETYDADANNRIFIFTDGDFNFGVTSEGGLADFIYQKRKTGIYLSIVGYGQGNFKDNKMEALAMNGNGNYTFVANPEDILDNLWDKLVSNLITVAKDVKISVEFNPAYVSEYRLIGYDARQLTQQEFHDTEKAADGIGSEHNVAALISLKRGTAEQRFSSRYVNAQAAENKDEFAFIEVHYKSPAGENLTYTKTVTLAELEGGKTDNIKVASLLAVFGLLVKRSAYQGDASPEMLTKLLDELDENERLSEAEPYGHFGIIRKYLKRDDSIKTAPVTPTPVPPAPVPPTPAPPKPVPHGPTTIQLVDWTCPSCGNKGNTEQFCDQCGAKKPDPGVWDCPACGSKRMMGLFCPVCGAPKPFTEAWDCPTCGEKNNTSNFCANCGTKKPEPPAPWDCGCGRKGITGKFCPDCGAKRPEPPAPWACACGRRNIRGKFCPSCGAKQPEAPSTWDCACGRTGITDRYCTDCGRRRPD